MLYTLDTNILLYYVRENPTRTFIETTFAPFSNDNEALISVVTVAEIMVLASANNWGSRKLALVHRLIDSLTIIEIKYIDIIDSYIEIEKYNRNIHPTKKRAGSHVAMGKNDSWIAATAMVTKSTLLTADLDFQHLDNVFIEVANVG